MEGALDVLSSLQTAAYGLGHHRQPETGDYNYRYLPGDALAQYQFGNGFVTCPRPTAFDPQPEVGKRPKPKRAVLILIFLSAILRGSIDVYQKEDRRLAVHASMLPVGTNLQNAGCWDQYRLVGKQRHRTGTQRLCGRLRASNGTWNNGVQTGMRSRPLAMKTETFLGIQYY